MTDPVKSVELLLQINYAIPPAIRQRYAKMLVNRATRFYLEKNLDRSTVDEDLADGLRNAGWYELRDDEESDLCNLIDSEKTEQEYQDELAEMVKKYPDPK